MKNWRKFLWQYWQVLLAVVAIIVLLIVTSAPNGSSQLSGSTYSKEPHGYGAWYQMMVDRSTPLERWRQNNQELMRQHPRDTTLLQVNVATQDLQLSTAEKDWIKQGNTLIVLGVDARANDIAFSQDLPSAHGPVRIETTRRLEPDDLAHLMKGAKQVVGDDAGNVIESAKIGEGHLIISTTPHLAANAYQDFASNYELLATLATADGHRLVVDEYLHGYHDASSSDRADRSELNGVTYLLQTPFLMLLINFSLVFGLVVWQQNRRFGAVIIPQPPAVENSTAYIQALGGVLRQAQSSDFVVKNIGKAEQLALQQRLGLGNQQLVDRATLLAAWQTQLPTAELPPMVPLATGQQLTESQLQQWLRQLQAVRDRWARSSS
jgi:Domain of unknown function (DUF4350)